MKLWRLAIVVIFLAGSGVPSRAQIDTGSTIQEKCQALDKTSDPFKAGYCAGFISAVQDVLAAWQVVDEATGHKHPPVVTICIPPEAVNGQILKVFLKFLDDHPEKLHQRASGLFIEAMQHAFSCHR